MQTEPVRQGEAGQRREGPSPTSVPCPRRWGGRGPCEEGPHGSPPPNQTVQLDKPTQDRTCGGPAPGRAQHPVPCPQGGAGLSEKMKPKITAQQEWAPTRERTPMQPGSTAEGSGLVALGECRGRAAPAPANRSAEGTTPCTPRALLQGARQEALGSQKRYKIKNRKQIGRAHV